MMFIISDERCYATNWRREHKIRIRRGFYSMFKSYHVCEYCIEQFVHRNGRLVKKW